MVNFWSPFKVLIFRIRNQNKNSSRDAATWLRISWRIYMHFPNEAKMTKPCSEASFNDNPNPRSLLITWLYNNCFFCFDQNCSWSIQFYIRQRYEENQRRETIQNILIKPHLCTKHIAAKSVLWKQVSSCVR